MTNTNLRDLLRSRRSIRRFKADPVPASVIQDLLATAAYAPSAHNIQPWRFVLVGQSGISLHESRQRLTHALTSAMRADMTAEGAPESEIETRVTRSSQRIHEAPALILVCRDLAAVREHKREDEIMAIQSVANVATYLLLAAHAADLGANWICWPLYAQEETQESLGLSKNWEPQAMIFIGYPDEEPKEKNLKSLEDMTFYR